jgi:D-alanine transaminase
MSQIVFLNGEYLPYEQAHISVEDRGFLLADGVYEVIRAYQGKLFALDEHLQRLERSLRELRIPSGLTLAQYQEMARQLIERNGLSRSDATVYMQVTRGAYNPRTHYFPKGEIRPTVLGIARAFKPMGETYIAEGVDAVTTPDTRWARCDIKSVALLPNALAKQQAVEAGAYEALFIRDGVAIEGSSSNFFAVIDGELRTYPRCNYILAGITRQYVLNFARALGVPTNETAITVHDLARASEAFVSSTTGEVVPIVRIDGKPVGEGKVGPIARQLYQRFQQHVASL